MEGVPVIGHGANGDAAANGEAVINLDDVWDVLDADTGAENPACTAHNCSCAAVQAHSAAPDWMQRARANPRINSDKLLEWAKKNADDPYPSRATKEMLAVESGHTVKQVRGRCLSRRARCP